MVIWIIGLSGSGKTYISNKLNKNKKNLKHLIGLDGDEIRKYLTYDFVIIKKIEKKFKKNSRFIKVFRKKGFLVIDHSSINI